MSISLNKPTIGSTNWGTDVNNNWTDIETMLNNPPDNLLINGGFDIFQRTDPSTNTTRANDTYGPDRWYILTNGGSTDIQISRSTPGDTHSKNACSIKQVNATAKKWAIAQIVESDSVISYRGSAVTFQMRAKFSGSAAPSLRVAIIEWTGTADNVTSDVVNDWNNSADANPATTFFETANQSIIGFTSAVAATGSYADFSVTANVSNSANNIIVVVWTSAAVSQNVIVEMTQAGLFGGDILRSWKPRHIQQEIALCQRYFEKSYNLDTDPGTITTSGKIMHRTSGSYSSAQFLTVYYKTQKRSIGTITIYSSGTGVSGKVRNDTTAADVNAIVTFEGTWGFSGSIQASVSDQNFVGFHFATDSEL